MCLDVWHQAFPDPLARHGHGAELESPSPPLFHFLSRQPQPSPALCLGFFPRRRTKQCVSVMSTLTFHAVAEVRENTSGLWTNNGVICLGT